MKKLYILASISLLLILPLVLFPFGNKTISLNEVISKRCTINSIDNLSCNTSSLDFENKVTDKLKIQDMFNFLSSLNVYETQKLESQDCSNFLFIQLCRGNTCDLALTLIDDKTICISNSSDSSIKCYELTEPINIALFKDLYLK